MTPKRILHLLGNSEQKWWYINTIAVTLDEGKEKAPIKELEKEVENSLKELLWENKVKRRITNKRGEYSFALVEK